MRNRAPEDRNASPALRRTMLVVVILALVAVAAFGSYVFARRDSNGIRSEAARRQAELLQVQDQLRSAAKQNDYLAEQVRQGTRALSNAGSDSQSAEQRLRADLRKVNAKLAKAEAKLHGLSSGLKGSLGSVTYIPPAKKGDPGTVQGTITINNSSGLTLDAVCVVDVGTVEYAIMSHSVPSKGSNVESFQFPYAGPKPSGSSSGGCGRL
jgi:hypothetical protein